MIRLLVAHAHPEVLQGLASALSEEPGFELLGATTSQVELLRQARDLRPDVVVVGFDAAGLDGPAICVDLHRISTRVRSVAALVAPNEADLVDALSAHAHAVVLQPVSPALLRTAIRTVASGWVFIDPRLARTLVHLAVAGAEAGLAREPVAERLLSRPDRTLALELPS